MSVLVLYRSSLYLTAQTIRALFSLTAETCPITRVGRAPCLILLHMHGRQWFPRVPPSLPPSLMPPAFPLLGDCFVNVYRHEFQLRRSKLGMEEREEVVAQDRVQGR